MTINKTILICRVYIQSISMHKTNWVFTYCAQHCVIDLFYSLTLMLNTNDFMQVN